MCRVMTVSRTDCQQRCLLCSVCPCEAINEIITCTEESQTEGFGMFSLSIKVTHVNDPGSVCLFEYPSGVLGPLEPGKVGDTGTPYPQTRPISFLMSLVPFRWFLSVSLVLTAMHSRRHRDLRPFCQHLNAWVVCSSSLGKEVFSWPPICGSLNHAGVSSLTNICTSHYSAFPSIFFF